MTMFESVWFNGIRSCTGSFSTKTRLAVGIGLVLWLSACGGCRRKSSAPAPEDGGGFTPVPAAPIGPSERPGFAPGPPGPLTRVGALPIKAAWPGNVTVEVQPGSARFAAAGFPTVVVTIERLTEENAVLRADIGGRSLPAVGAGFDGRMRVLQTECLLIRCAVDASGGVGAEAREAALAVCDSLAAAPERHDPFLREVRRASFAFRGSCSDADLDLGEVYLERAAARDLREAIAACWRAGASGLEDAPDVVPGVWTRWVGKPDAEPTFAIEVRGLSGDTTALAACAATALEPLRIALPPDTRVSAACTSAELAVAYDLGRRERCTR
jgi:hypothetical protein